jgi:hypothetical protein
MQNSASTIKQNTEEIGIEGHQFCDLTTAEVGYNQAGNWEDGITIPICRPHDLRAVFVYAADFKAGISDPSLISIS